VASCVFVVFCHSIAHSCRAIFVPEHYFMCHGVALFAAAQFFVPRGCFCAAGLLLCQGVVLCAAAVCDLVPQRLWFVPRHCMMCRAIAQCVFFAAALCFVPWCFFVCHGITQCAVALRFAFVQWRCFCATALCDVPQHCVMC